MNALSDEDQLDNLKSFTKKYGSAIISGILIALIAFFGWNTGKRKLWLRTRCVLPRCSSLWMKPEM